MLEGDIWGDRKDIDEYFSVPDEAVTAIKSMTKEGIALDEIAKEVQSTTNLGSELIKFIAQTEIKA